MLWIILAMGGLAVLLLALTVLLFRKKKGGVFVRSLLILLTAAFAACAITQGVSRQKQIATDKENVYLGMCYLSDGGYDAAHTHFAAVSAQSGGCSFSASCGEILRLRLTGSDTLADLKSDALGRGAALSGQQKKIASYLGTHITQDETGEYVQNVTAGCLALMKISASDTARLQAAYQAEAMSLGGYGGGSSAGAENQRLQINSALSSSDYTSALNLSCSLVAADADVQNRLLLAEVVAEMTYAGEEVPAACFYQASALPAGFVDSEAASCTQKYQEKSLALTALQNQIDAEKDAGKLADLQKQKEALFEEVTDLQNHMKHIYVYRAINAIGDIHTVQSSIIQARLYYSMQDYGKSAELLSGAADSLEARLSPDTTLRESLRVVKNVYSGKADPAAASSDDFVQAVSRVSMAAVPDLIAVSVGPLSRDMNAKIVGDLKYQSNALYVTDFDATAFPQVTVTLAGRDEVVSAIESQTNITASDTHSAVTYTVLDKEAAAQQAVCIVLDTSGSMDGGPLLNAQGAITDFVRGLDPASQAAVAHFSDYGQVDVPLSGDHAAAIEGIQSLGIEGGTNIGAGIQAGMEALGGAGGARTILLLTDGQSDFDPSIAQSAREQGIKIFTIGFGDVNDELLQSIADTTGGMYVHADSSSELSSVYNSLGSIVGNQVTIRYTVSDNPDETSRYFFLGAADYSASARCTYGTAAASAAGAPQITSCNSPIYTVSEQADIAAAGNELGISLRGSRLGEITGVTVGGVPAQIENGGDDASLRLSVAPTFAAGTYDAEFTCSDGSSFTQRYALTICPDEGLHYYSTYRLGALRLSADQAAYLGGGIVVMNGVSFEDGLAAGSGTLYAEPTGAVALSVEAENTDYGDSGYIDLGGSGTFWTQGAILLEYSDSSAGGWDDAVMASGDLAGTCTPEQCTITQREG